MRAPVLTPAARVAPLVVAIAATLAPTFAAAEDADELRKELEAAKSMIRRMEDRLKALESAPARAPAAKPAPVVVEKTTTVVTEPVFVLIDIPERFNDNGYGDPRPNRDLRAEKKGFVDIQGTDTSFKIGGFVKMDAMYDTNPIGSRDWLVQSSIPTTAPDNQRGPQFGINARATRLNFEFRRNTEFGLAKIFLENDFFGNDRTDFTPGPYGWRLRHAYGQVGPWTVGRTFSNFMDIDSWPDTLEFYGPSAATFIFTSQVRYTQGLGNGLSASGAVETPRSDVDCGAVNNCPRERLPDVTGKLRWEQPWGHLQGTALLRHLAYATPVAGAGSATGLGVQFSGSVKSGLGNDYAAFSTVAGNGIQRYINDPGYFGALDGVVGPQGQFDTLGVFGGYAGYTHFWDGKTRSTVSAGFVDTENSAFQAATAYNRTQYLTLNYVWTVFGSLNVGAEVVYAERKDRAGNTGDLVRLLFSAQYNLVR
ncbi:MAG: porin [Burkholderiales bacterium]|jgi:hypothetical protein|nr:porin [Burkholderiales bacterium]